MGSWTGGQEGRCDHVTISGKYAFVTDLESLHVLDLSKPAVPVRVGFNSIRGPAFGVAVVGNYAFVCGNVLHILQLSPVPKLNIAPTPGAVPDARGSGWRVAPMINPRIVARRGT
ncbi:MAG: hypothetical protein O3C21_21350 [Verrucomicrobia bacterium]|nr:hypothetical protein [Verrucomicrobiota bacterium]